MRHATRPKPWKAGDGVPSSPDDLLLQLENSLRREAAEFARKAFSRECRNENPEVLVEKVTGISVRDSSGAAAARSEIIRKLAGERRRARRGSAVYDLNRHISLSRALDALARLEFRPGAADGTRENGQ
jgi:hypothetical protein